MEKSTPQCPKCNSEANVVKMELGFRCAFCGEKFYEGIKEGQTTLR